MDTSVEFDSNTIVDIDFIINNVEEHYHPNYWTIYKDLLDTQCCPEDYDYYDWSDINKHYLFQNIIDCKRNFIDNFNNIINIVRDIIIDMYDGPEFTKYGELFTVNEWVLDGLECCSGCGRIWDGCAQCDCFMYL